MATLLHRRTLLAAAPAAVLAACEPGLPTTASSTPQIDLKGLDRTVAAIAAQAAPAVLGVGLMNLESAQTYVFNGDRRFPMQSVFKLPLAAAVFAEIDAGRLTPAEPFDVTKADLSTPFSAIGAAWPGRTVYTAQELLQAMVCTSDNTAADILMKRVGGPGAVTAWLVGKHITDIRVDRYERQFQPEVYGMASFRPAWRTDAGFEAARAAVPPATRLAAMRAYMADPRDTATPAAMVAFLQMLNREELISSASTRRLLELMARTQPGAGRLRAGLAKEVFLAHRPGTSGVEQGINAATNDVGLFTLPDRRAYAIAVFLTGSTLDGAGRDAVIARVASAALKAVG